MALSVLVPHTAWDGYMSSTGEELAAFFFFCFFCWFFFLKLSWIKLPLFSRVGCSVPGKTGCLKRWGIGIVFNKPTVKHVGTEQNQTAYTTFCSATDTTQSQQPTSMPSSEAFHADTVTQHMSHICSSTAENRREVATEQERKAFCCTEAKKLSAV